MQRYIFVAIFLHFYFFSFSQASLSSYDRISSLPDKFFTSAAKKAEKLQERLQRASLKYLRELEKSEGKMKRQLSKKDSLGAEKAFGNVSARYSDLRSRLNTAVKGIQKLYSPHLDSMSTALAFINHNNGLKKTPQLQLRLQSTFDGYNNVQDKLNQTEYIKQQIEERSNFLKSRLDGLSLVKEFKKYQANFYYYRAQTDNYKKIWENPQKMESALLRSVVKTPFFKKYFSKYSELASLFQLPDNDEISTVAINGMQTRGIIMQQVGQQFINGNSAMQSVNSSVNEAKDLMQPIKEKLYSLTQKGNDPQMPDYNPNQDKIKPILKRIEIGANIQSIKSNYFFPSTTDFGLSIGYKLNSKAIIGVGGSYKVGWGKDIRHLVVSHEGVGLRTFVDIKLKAFIWFSGGAEMNYRSAVYNFEVLKNKRAWQKSALAGLKKSYKVNKMKGELKLFYDFLWKSQSPSASPLVFRTGYTF